MNGFEEYEPECGWAELNRRRCECGSHMTALDAVVVTFSGIALFVGYLVVGTIENL